MAGKIVSDLKPRTTSGISGPGGRNVAPIYKPFGGLVGGSNAPKIPVKPKSPSFIERVVQGFKKEMTRPTQRVRSTDFDK